MDKKHNCNECAICTTNPSLYKSVNPVKTWLGDGKRCFVPEVPINQITIKRINQPNKINVLLVFDNFSKGVKIFIIKSVLKKQRHSYPLMDSLCLY